MARRSREAVQKRIRERKRAEKAEQKRLKKLARKQGRLEDFDETAEGETDEPRPDGALPAAVAPVPAPTAGAEPEDGAEREDEAGPEAELVPLARRSANG